MKRSILNLESIAAACILTASSLAVTSVAQAGTVGMTGQWTFQGQTTFYDSAGDQVVSGIGTSETVGLFDFTAGTANLEEKTPFFGLTWHSSGSLTDNGDGTYSSTQTGYWGATSFPWAILWEITQNGNTATVHTLDADSDGIPGTKMTTGPFTDFSMEVNGTLTAVVPVPAAAWLFGSGLVGLIGVAGHRARKRG